MNHTCIPMGGTDSDADCYACCAHERDMADADSRHQKRLAEADKSVAHHIENYNGQVRAGRLDDAARSLVYAQRWMDKGRILRGAGSR